MTVIQVMTEHDTQSKLLQWLLCKVDKFGS